MLLPTPQATDGTKGGPNQPARVAIAAERGNALADTASSRRETSGEFTERAQAGIGKDPRHVRLAAAGVYWGDYGPAVGRWERVLSRPAPGQLSLDGLEND